MRLTQYKLHDLRNFYFSKLVDDFFKNRIEDRPFSIDVQEHSDSYTIEADLPGIKKEDIKLEYTRDDRLIISVEHVDEGEEEKGKDQYIYKERNCTSMHRELPISDINADEVKAELKDGVLKIVAPKLAVTDDKKRYIEIR